MGLREVSTILWRERHLLELLLFKLDEEQLVRAAGRTRWLPRATREVEMVLEELRQTELERAVEVSRVTGDLGLPAGAGLRQLAEAARPPWQGMLLEHRRAFLTLTDEITALVQTNLRRRERVRPVLPHRRGPVSDFDGLRIALSSLHAQRRTLQVTGQNIADARPEPCSRL